MILTLKPILPQIASSVINIIPIRLSHGDYFCFLFFTPLQIMFLKKKCNLKSSVHFSYIHSILLIQFSDRY